MLSYEKKVESAIKLIQSIPQDGPIELCYSGGKDSDVILELAKMSGVPVVPIYKMTTLDPPGTTKHAQDMGVEIRRPKETFLQLVERKGNPSRFRRFCCEVLKEYKIYDRSIVGIRRSESTRRAARYKEPEECRIYRNGEKTRQYYPILEWTDEDVERFIKERGIKCAPVYYDEEGNFHVERRLGCLGCPLKSDNGLADFKKYPKLLRNQVRAYQRFLDKHTTSSFYKRVEGRAINAFFYYLFCHSSEEYDMLTGGGAQLFDSQRVKPIEFMENYFGIKFEDVNGKQ